MRNLATKLRKIIIKVRIEVLPVSFGFDGVLGFVSLPHDLFSFDEEFVFFLVELVVDPFTLGSFTDFALRVEELDAEAFAGVFDEDGAEEAASCAGLLFAST